MDHRETWCIEDVTALGSDAQAVWIRCGTKCYVQIWIPEPISYCIYVNSFKNLKVNAYMVPNSFALSDTQPVVVSLQQALVLIFHANS